MINYTAVLKVYVSDDFLKLFTESSVNLCFKQTEETVNGLEMIAIEVTKYQRSMFEKHVE